MGRSDETQQLWLDFRRTGDQKIRDRLILTYAPLVKYVAGRLGSGLPALIPFGSLGRAMKYDDFTAPLQMAAIALPAFNSPLNGMVKLGLMFDHGNSVGAAFVLFMLGLGLNLGVIAWLITLYGWRRTGVWGTRNYTPSRTPPRGRQWPTPLPSPSAPPAASSSGGGAKNTAPGAAG